MDWETHPADIRTGAGDFLLGLGLPVVLAAAFDGIAARSDRVAACGYGLAVLAALTILSTTIGPWVAPIGRVAAGALLLRSGRARRSASSEGGG